MILQANQAIIIAVISDNNHAPISLANNATLDVGIYDSETIQYIIDYLDATYGASSYTILTEPGGEEIDNPVVFAGTITPSVKRMSVLVSRQGNVKDVWMRINDDIDTDSSGIIMPYKAKLTTILGSQKEDREYRVRIYATDITSDDEIDTNDTLVLDFTTTSSDENYNTGQIIRHSLSSLVVFEMDKKYAVRVTRIGSDCKDLVLSFMLEETI